MNKNTLSKAAIIFGIVIIFLYSVVTYFSYKTENKVIESKNVISEKKVINVAPTTEDSVSEKKTIRVNPTDATLTTENLYNSSPTSTVKNFYTWYLSCLDNHFKKPNGKPPAQNCVYESSPYVNKNLSVNLAGKRGADLILCAQNTPVSFTVGDFVVNDKTASVTVHTKYEESGDNPLLVTLESDDNKWFISNIECSH